MMLQSDYFLNGEGDSWFTRNQDYLLSQETANVGKFDWVSWLVENLKQNPDRVAELGCSNGWRLNRLQKSYSHSQLYGLDISEAAIQDGQVRYPKLNLCKGMIHELPWENEFFNLAIIYSVFHWVDRRQLAHSIAEVDRIVCDGGYLVVGDFLPNYPQRRGYHHLPGEAVYTYKQDYAKCFTALGTYQEVARFTYNHQLNPQLTFQAAESSERFSCVLLQKDINQGYPIV